MDAPPPADHHHHFAPFLLHPRWRRRRPKLKLPPRRVSAACDSAACGFPELLAGFGGRGGVCRCLCDCGLGSGLLGSGFRFLVVAVPSVASLAPPSPTAPPAAPSVLAPAAPLPPPPLLPHLHPPPLSRLLLLLLLLLLVFVMLTLLRRRVYCFPTRHRLASRRAAC